jgi:hypothetical protein
LTCCLVLRTSYCAWHFQEQLLIGPTLRLSRDWINSAPLSSPAFFPLSDSEFEINVRSLHNSLLGAGGEICEKNLYTGAAENWFPCFEYKTTEKQNFYKPRRIILKMSLESMGCENRNFISLAERCAVADRAVVLRSPWQGRRTLNQLFNHREDYTQFRL